MIKLDGERERESERAKSGNSVLTARLDDDDDDVDDDDDDDDDDICRDSDWLNFNVNKTYSESSLGKMSKKKMQTKHFVLKKSARINRVNKEDPEDIMKDKHFRLGQCSGTKWFYEAQKTLLLSFVPARRD